MNVNFNKKQLTTLTWKGPEDFSKFEKSYKQSTFCNCGNDNTINDKGLYLMCIKPDKDKHEYAAYYVGSTPETSIYDRVHKWYLEIDRGAAGMYLDSNDVINHGILIKKFIKDGEKIPDAVKKYNIVETFIFYLHPSEDLIKSLPAIITKPILELEGLVKNILRRKMESRKYYLSLEYPKYGLNYNDYKCVLENKEYSIIGF